MNSRCIHGRHHHYRGYEEGYCIIECVSPVSPTKCTSGTPPCREGMSEEDCHSFHCSRGCTHFRGENISCRHECRRCGFWLGDHHGNWRWNSTLGDHGRFEGYVHDHCPQGAPVTVQSTLEEFF